MDRLIDYFHHDRGVTVRPAHVLDIEALKDRLSHECEREVMASHGHTPEQALLWSYVTSSVKLAVERNGQVVAMFGLQDSRESSKVACAWLLTAQEIDHMPVTFMKLSKRYLRLFLDERPVLFNWIDARFERSLEWARRLGGEVSPAQPYGPGQKAFCHVLFLKGGK